MVEVHKAFDIKSFVCSNSFLGKSILKLQLEEIKQESCSRILCPLLIKYGYNNNGGPQKSFVKF